MRIPATMISAVPRTVPMMIDVLCDDDDNGFDGGEELAGDVEGGRDEAGIDDPGGDALLPGEDEEEVVRGVEESVRETED